MTAFKLAPLVLENGYSPVPLRADTGTPTMKGWDGLRDKPLSLQSIALVIQKQPHVGMGVVGGFNGLVPIDVDTDDPEVIEAFCSVMPEPLVVRRGSKGFVAFYVSTKPIIGRKFCRPDGKPVVEILTRGNVSIPPTLHRKTGKAYYWGTHRTMFDTHVSELSEVTPEHIATLAKTLAPWCPPKVYAPIITPKDTKPTNDKRMKAWAERCLSNEMNNLITVRGGRNWALFKAACKLAKYVHHGVLSEMEVVASLESACKINGYEAKAGKQQAYATIRSGLDKGRGDQLPVLQDKPYERRYNSSPAYR
jgi:hypothetical protein